MGINITVLVSICYIINGLCLHCIILKWFFEDISTHLFHFLDEDHVHESCPADNSTSLLNSTSSHEFRSIELSYTKKTHTHSSDEHVLFKTYSIMKTFELLTNFIYFLSLIIFKFFIKKCQLSKRLFKNVKALFSRSNPVPELSSRNEPKVNLEANTSDSSEIKILNKNIRLNTIKKSFSLVFFYFLIALILVFTLSVSSFSIKIKCESFFKNSKLVSKVSFLTINQFLFSNA